MTGRVAGWGLVAALSVAVLAGCTGEDSADPAPSVTGTTASPSPSPSPAPREPVLPAAARKPTRAGATAFYYYFWDVYNYSFSSLRAGTLRKVSARTCDFCLAAASRIEERPANSRYEGGVVSVDSVVAAPGDPRIGLLINSVLSQSDGKQIDKDGKAGPIVRGHSMMRIDAAVAWNGKSWRLLKIDAGAINEGS